MLNLVTQKTHLPDLKSIIVDDEKLFVIMTSLRPKLKHSGKEMEGKKDDTKRIIVENSQIYRLDLAFLNKMQFFNPSVKQRAGISQF